MRIYLVMSNNPERLFNAFIYTGRRSVVNPKHNIKHIGFVAPGYDKYQFFLKKDLDFSKVSKEEYAKNLKREFKWEWLKNQYPEIVEMTFFSEDVYRARPEDMDLEQKAHFITACYVEGYYADIYNTVGNHLSNYSEEQINAQFEKLLNESVEKTMGR